MKVLILSLSVSVARKEPSETKESAPNLSQLVKTIFSLLQVLRFVGLGEPLTATRENRYDPAIFFSTPGMEESHLSLQSTWERKKHIKRKRVKKVHGIVPGFFGGDFVYVFFLPHKE